MLVDYIKLKPVILMKISVLNGRSIENFVLYIVKYLQRGKFEITIVQSEGEVTTKILTEDYEYLFSRIPVLTYNSYMNRINFLMIFSLTKPFFISISEDSFSNEMRSTFKKRHFSNCTSNFYIPIVPNDKHLIRSYLTFLAINEILFFADGLYKQNEMDTLIETYEKFDMCHCKLTIVARVDQEYVVVWRSNPYSTDIYSIVNGILTRIYHDYEKECFLNFCGNDLNQFASYTQYIGKTIFDCNKHTKFNNKTNVMVQ